MSLHSDGTPILSLLQDCRDRRIRLWTENRKLRFKAPPGAMTDAIKQRLRAHRDDLIEFLEEAAKAPTDAIEPRADDGPAELSFSQRRMWFQSQLPSAGAAFNVVIALDVRGPLDLAALDAAYRLVVERHTALRTRFHAIDGEPRQTIVANSFRLETIDLTGLDPEPREPGADTLAQQAILTHFDLEHGPLFRAILLVREPDHYSFIVAAHHICFDGWSIDILLKESETAYRALVHGTSPNLPPLPIQYADYSVWQTSTFQGERMQSELAHWRETLADMPLVLDLPRDKPRPTNQTFRGKLQSASLPEALAARIDQLTRASDTTPFMVLLAGYAALLGVSSGQRDFAVGIPIAGRARTEVQPLIGFFVNTLAIRLQPGAATSFEDLLGETRTRLTRAYDHQDLPFDVLVSALDLARDPAYPPVCQVSFSLNEVADRERATVYGLHIAPLDKAIEHTKFDLSFSVQHHSAGYFVTVEYNTDLFTAATMSTFFDRYIRLMDAVLSQPSLPITSDLILTDEERERMVRAWNQTARPQPAGALIDLFGRQVRRNPDAVAIDDQGTQLSYAALEARSGTLAAALWERGIRPGSRVGIELPRGHGFATAVIAIVRLGAVCVPLDVTQPTERVRFVIEDSGIALLIGSLEEATVPCLDPAEIDRAAATPVVATDPSMPCLLIYTSGTTGRPKGVLVPQRGIIRLVVGSDYVAYGPEDRVTQVANPVFDAYSYEHWGPLLNGGCMVIMPREVMLDADRLAAWWRARGITVMWLPTALVHRHAAVRGDLFAGLANLTIGGEAAELGPLRRILETGPPRRLINLYGPTENATVSTFYEVTDLGPDTLSVPIGNPIANSTCHVTDRGGRLVPPGTPGELAVGGPGLALGYVGRPGLTAAVFIPDSFSGEPGARLYRTGDLVRSTGGNEPDLIFLGRIDHQVKLRGFRIELGGIESALNESPAVARAAVLLRKDLSTGEGLVAYVQLEGEGGQLDPTALTQHLAAQLPDYMVPAHFVALDTLPHTAGGKINRGALARLPPPETDAAEKVPARDPLEHALVASWTDIIGTEPGIRDNFFALGGHSLLATRALAFIRARFGVQIPLPRFFETPTIEQLAALIDDLRAVSGAAPIGTEPATPTGLDSVYDLLRHCRIEGLEIRLENGKPRLEAGPDQVVLRNAVEDHAEQLVSLLQGIGDATPFEAAPRDRAPVPSFTQTRLWFLDQLHGPATTFNMANDLEVTGEIDPLTLERAAREVYRRHDVLRTVFPPGDGEPAPQLLPVESLSLVVSDTPESEVVAVAESVLARPFDLARGPMLAVILIRFAPGKARLLITMHHIVSDAWSQGIFTHELTTAYDAFSHDRDHDLPEPVYQFSDFARWQRRYMPRRLERQLAFWKETLAGELPVVRLPADRPEPTVPDRRGGTRQTTLNEVRVEALDRLCREADVTRYMAILAIFEVLIHRLSGQDDLIIGTPVAGRSRSETESMMGCFINFVPLRADLGGNPRFRDLLARIRQTVLAAFANQDLPFDRMVEAVQPERVLARNPIYDIGFNMVNTPTGSVSLSGLSFAPSGRERTNAERLLTLTAREHPAGMALSLDYYSAWFDATRIEAMLDQLVSLFDQILTEPNREILSYPLGGAPIGDPSVQIPAPIYPSVLTRFAEHAANTPEAPALAWDEVAWTYGTLESRVDRLARCLRDAGLEAGQTVAYHGTRTPALVVAVLAVMRAGGVLLTVDADLPKRRRQTMIDVAGTRFLLLAEGKPPRHKAELLAIDPVEGRLDREPVGTAPFAKTEPDDPAYIFFTSGSTGIPKGVLGCHKGLDQFAVWQGETFAFSAEDRVAQTTGISFDALSSDIFLALANGALLLLPGRQVTMDGGSILPWLAETRATRCHAVPSLLRAWLADVPEGLELPDLRSVFVAGEPFPEATAVAWYARFGAAAELVNIYGPTETTLVKTYLRVPDPPYPGEQPAGQPLPDTQILILNRAGLVAGMGETGEIAIRTPFACKGYLNAPDEQAARFRRNPFSDDPDDIVYFTGDLGRYRPDGLLEVLGRRDDQVKIRGVRVELGEVESVLNRHPLVASAAVAARRDQHGIRFLVAYLTGPDLGGHGDVFTPAGEVIDDLRRFLASRLLDAMIPTVFVGMHALPLLPNGKLARNQLPDPDRLELGVTTGFTEPATATERALTEIWAEVLGLERVGAEDDFFRSGGHSLMAIQVITRVRDRLEIEMPLARLFETPVLRDLAAWLDRQGASVEASLPRVPRDGVLPVSYGQERLWFLDRLEGGSGTYNMPIPLMLRGPLDIAALEASFTAVTERHEILRTNIVETETGTVLRPREATTVTARVIELPVTGDPRALVEAELARPFDLAHDPLLRLCIVRSAPDQNLVVAIMHHIVSDGWSTNILLDEVTRGYHAAVTGGAVSHPPLPVQYVDYAAWQRRTLSGDTLREKLHFWQDQLAGLPARIDLPYDRPRPAAQTFPGASRPLQLGAERSARVHALARETNATPFMVLLTAFETMLYRLSGQDDFAVGTPVAGRPRKELEPLIGLFINTLALRCRIDGNTRFTELIARTKETALAAFTHAEVPFELVVEAVHPHRDISHSPLFQVLFILQNTPERAVALPGLEVSGIEAARQVARFDLTLGMREDTRGFSGSLEYNTDLFDAATADRFIGYLLTLTDAALSSPDQPIARLNMLADDERARLMETWNATAAEIPDQPITASIRAGDTPALISGERNLSHTELREAVTALAGRLHATGVHQGSRVAILAERTPEAVIGMLATMMAGGSYVPIDPALPEARIAYMLADAEPSVVLTDRAEVPETRAVVMGFDATGAEPLTKDHARLEGAAYTIYTSGSTGKPKGVTITHRALINFLASMAREPGLTTGDRLLAVTTFSFDIAGLELYLPLMLGATVVLASTEEAADAVRLEAMIGHHRITAMQATPATWNLLREAGWQGAPELAILCGGEALPLDLARWLTTRGRGVWNLYGPTETTIWSAVHEIEPDLESVRVGHPIANTQIYVLDQYGEPVAPRVTGQLMIAGAGLARGYVGKPALTAEKFTPNPFGPAGARLYATGDLARYGHDGTLEVAGRIDHQVKLRGFRIELGDIESALADSPAIARAVVLLRTDLPTGEGLVAYCQLEGDGGPADVRRTLEKTLPSYMLPSHYEVLDRFPLTPNGKIDRNALARQTPVAAEQKTEHIEPRNEIERALARIWCAVLGREKVSAVADFFDLGGHSLLATRVVARIRAEWGIALPLRDLFTAPTIAQLAERVTRVLADGGAVSAQPIPRRDAEDPPVLSYAQERMWFLDMLERMSSPDRSAYTIHLTLGLNGSLNIAALESAIGDILTRHEALRTIFPSDTGQPQPELIDVDAVSLERHDFRDEQDPDATVRDAATRAISRPFDLACGPLTRFTLFQLAEDRHVLVTVMHHIVSDGWSIGVLTKELTGAYAARLRGETPVLPELPIQYGDYASWQRGWLTAEVLDAQTAWWKDYLDGVPELLTLPTDHPRPAERSGRGGNIPFHLDAATLDGLRRMARSHGATLFMALQAGFATLLGRYSGQDTIAIGSPVANRPRAELEPLIGFFVNTLVFRNDLDGNPRFTELVARVRDAGFAAFAHADAPFEQVVDAVQPTRDMGRTPLFQVMLVLQNAPLEGESLPDLTLVPVETEHTVAKFDLTLNVMETPAGLSGGLEYATDLFTKTTARRLTDQLAHLLSEAIANPDRRLTALALEPESTSLAASSHLNETERPDRAVPIHQLFEATVADRGDTPALVTGEDEIDYATLNAAANRVAARLIAEGVVVETPVAICLERGIEMVVAMLAVLKAGGAYVPLDPAYPLERLHYTLRDSGAALVLTSAKMAAVIPAEIARTLAVDAIDAGSTENPNVVVSPENPSHIIYTSGSTGKPKGVVVRHAAVAALIEWQRRTYDPAALAGVAAVTSICFDLSVFEILGTLCLGGTVIMAENAAELPNHPARDRIRLLNTVPSAMTELSALDALPDHLRVVNLAGEPLRGALVREVYRREHIEAVFNLYGPSEDTTYSTAAAIPRGSKDEPSIGAPIDNTRVYLLDGAGGPVPARVTGELCLGGHGLARGYLNRPALTADRFRPNPFDGSGTRLYKTGDLARLSPAGTLEFLGRRDHQVKLRGFRIELGEIESALADEPEIAQAVVLLRRDLPGDDALVAYVQTAGEKRAHQLRSWLEQRMPLHMIPAFFVCLREMPLLPNGKIDRDALPLPERAPSADEATLIAPRDELEQTFCDLFAELLRLEPDAVGINTHFFELGGHSLMATRLISRVQQELGVMLDLRTIFTRPTPARLAESLRDETEPARNRIARIEPLGPEAPPVLSYAQQRMWFLDQLEGRAADREITAYNIPYALRLTGPLDIPALEAAIVRVTDRHQALRTVFPTVDDEPRPVILPEGSARLWLVDIADSEAREDHLITIAEAEKSRGFDLATGPLITFNLIRLSGDDHALMMGMHHIVSDAWSISLLIGELVTAYAALSTDREPPLSPLPIQYNDYASWQRDWLSGENLDRQLAYWKDQLSGMPALLTLPLDRKRPPVQTFRGDSLVLTIDARTASGLRSISQRTGATMFMTLQAAFALLLSRYSGMTDIAIGTPIAGRNRAELEPLIGLFVNTLVMRIAVDEDQSFEELVSHTAETALAAYAHQDVPFDQVVEAVQPERALNHAALVQVMFSFQNTPGAESEGMPGLSIRPIETPHVTAKMDLSLDLTEIDGGLRGMLEYNTDLFDGSTIEAMAARFRRLLVDLTRDSDLPTRAVPLHIPDETRQWLMRWTDRTAPIPDDGPAELFENAARDHASLTAVEAYGEALTYAELAARVGSLAGALRTEGVRPGQIVALWLRPGTDLITAMLAVNRIGAVYLPLDIDWPDARIAFALTDAGAVLALTGPDVRPLPGTLPTLDVAEACETRAESPPVVALPAEAPAYLMYTSGSTGRPKGVLVTGRGIVRLVINSEFFRFTDDDRVAQVANPAFDVSTREVWGALLNGACLVVFPRELALRPDDMATWIAEMRITIMSTATALFNQLMSERANLFEHVRAFSMGGEAVDPLAVRRCLEAGPPTRLINAYGPTENTGNSSWHLIASLPDHAASVPIGVPITNSTCYVIDHNGRLTPPGLPGELWVGGPGLAIGYHGRPALTAAAFVPDPFSDAPGARLYRTGDEVRLVGRDAPVLVFLGRLDAQVKLRGFRIELGEIESAIADSPSVAEAAVLLRRDLPTGDGLVAYVRLEGEGEHPDKQAIAASLAAKLPGYMIPTVTIPVAALPHTSGGKIDRRALARMPLPEDVLGVAKREYVAPASETEEKVAHAWRTTLNLDRVGTDANFFELGGHSLLLVKLQRRLGEAFETEVALVDLIANPTVATQARLLAPQPTIEPVREEIDHGARRRSAAKRKRDRWKKRRGPDDRS